MKRRLVFHQYLLISLVVLILILPFSKADVVVKEGWVFRTTSNNVRFALDAEITLYRYVVNSSWIALYKSYTDGYYTVYGLEVTSPNNVNLTINTFFATANSSARFTIDAPSSTNIGFSFYSPHLLSATVSGEVVGSETWTAANKTLSFTVNTDTSITFTISATVTETAETNLTPENISIEITDLEGCGNWVFSEGSYYTFRAKFWDGNGYADLDTCKINFSDGVTDVVAAYDVVTSTWYLESGSDVVNLQAGTLTVLDSNAIQVTYLIYFENTILDCLDVDLYMWCNDTSGAEDGWDLIQTDYFNIYNLGANSVLTSSGNAGRLEGGDVFELYAHNNSWVEVESIYRNLQHIKMLVYLSYWGDKNETASLKYTFSYCTEQDEWIDPGFEIEIRPIEGKVPPSSPSEVWWHSNVYFRLNGQLIKNETIYHFIKAVSVTLPGFGTIYGTASSSLWIDIWFNRINASTIIGGRVNAYEYPMKDSASGWVKWLKSDWGPYETLRKQSMCFATMTHEDSSTLSTKEIQLVKVKCNISMDAQTYPAQSFFSATDYDVFDLTFGTSPLQGIQTPVFDETRVPVMPQGGFLGALFSQFAWLFSGLAGAFGPAILAFWNAFVGFMDTVFSTFGWHNGFSQIVNFIANLITWFSVALGYFVSLVTTGFAWITQAFNYMILGFSQFIGGLNSVVSWIGWMWAQLVADWG